MAISDAFLQELRMKTDIEEIISPYVNLKRRGRNLVGLCPFHNEKTPSFTVYPQNQSFYCFGCSAAGDAITFVRRAENFDYVEAVKFLAQKANLRMPEDGVDDTLMKRRREILDANRKAAKFFHAQLFSPAGEQALQYLLTRGITKKTIRQFGLGYAPNEWRALLGHLKAEGFSEQLLVEANLARRSERDSKTNIYDSFRGRIMFPIIDPRGNVIAFGGRIMDNTVPKYINTSDTLVYKKSHGVYALNFAKNENSGKLIIVEGYMDVIALHQAGFTNAVACLGTALTREQANVLSRYADEVILAYDTDNAGQKATRRAIDVFNTTSLKVRVPQLTGGKDPDEIIRTHGKERFRDLLEGAANDIEYNLLREKEKYDITTDDGKLSYLNAATNYLAQLSGAMERDIYASRLAEELQVDAKAIKTRIETLCRKNKKKQQAQQAKEWQRELLTQRDPLNPEASENPRATRAQEVLLTSLMRNPDYYPKLKDRLQPEQFGTGFYRRVFTVLCERLAENREIEPMFLSQEFSPQEMGRITKLYLESADIHNSLQECADCIRTLQEESSRKAPVDVASLSAEEYLQLFKKESQ